MDLPPDFHIEFAILNMHVWFILRRLKVFNNKKSEMMSKALQHAFRRYCQIEVNKIHLKKKNDFIKDLEYFCDLNRQNYEKHFYNNPKTSSNPYYKIDALMWSTIFFEKVERYSDRVYIMSEYMVKHFNYINHLSQEDLERGQVDFDVYRNSLDFTSKIKEINPPLTEEEFEAELNSDKPVKAFFYNYDDPDHEMPIDIEMRRPVNWRYELMMAKIGRTANKFYSIDTYDYYNDREEKEEEKKKREDKYVWTDKSDRDLMDFLAEKYDKVKPYDKTK